jgi:photosystem II stability/assembly factor-like uncharacterized protein
VPRILVHPRNPDIVYVAAMGPLWASGGERGVYKTTNGGRSWTRVLFVNETTGATDLVFDPTNPDVLYAAMMQRERKAYSFVAGGPASGIYKTTDGGVNWRRLERGLPTGDKGRIGVDISLAQPRTLYAFVDAQDGGIFRSDDGGDSWTRQSNLNSLPWFTGQVRADTESPDRVYHLGQQFSVSEDGGRNWRTIAGSTHVDYHAMWINPNEANHLLVGNDGGFFVSHDAGEAWEFAVNLPISTFYAIGIDMRDPYWVYGGLQDNGTWGAPTETRHRTGIGNSDWVNVGGGDGFYAQIDPTDPLTMYSESQNGALNRVDLPTNERKSIRPSAEPGLEYRFNWSAPLVISRYDNRTLYFGGNHLFKSTDRGDSWTRLGGDLTRDLNRDTLPIMGLSQAGGFRRHEGTAAFGDNFGIAAAARPALRRHRRWPHPGHARRRPDVAAHRQLPRRPEPLVREPNPGVRAHRRYRVRDQGQPPGQRLQSIRPEVDRLRADVDVDRIEPAGRLRSGHRRTSQEPGPALRGHGVRSVHDNRRRRVVVAHDERPAPGRGPRSGHPLT